MPGRKFNSGNYRFGFNGKENDKEWGNQLIQDYGFRLYNPAIGKFLSVDPLAPEYPELTTYQFASNSPIAGSDLDGLEFKLEIFPGDKQEYDALFDVLNTDDVYAQRTFIYKMMLRTKRGDLHSRAATLEKGNNPTGLTINIYDNFGNTTDQIHYDSRRNVFGFAVGSHDSQNYPVDVHLANETPNLEPGAEFYGKFDFIANEYEASIGNAVFSEGTSVIAGNMRGQGAVLFTATFKGVEPLSMADLSFNKVFGTYNGNGIPTRESFAGVGRSKAIGYSVSGGRWVGFDINGDISWRGYWRIRRSLT